MTPVPSAGPTAPRMPWLHLMAALSIAHAHRVPYARFTYARVSSPVVSTLWPGPNPNRACTFRAGDQIVDQLVDQIVGTPSPITLSPIHDQRYTIANFQLQPWPQPNFA